jgi:uncharacterized membrane protein YesL
VYSLIVAAFIALIGLFPVTAAAQAENRAPVQEAAVGESFKQALASVEIEPARVATIMVGGIFSVVVLNTLSRLPLFSPVLADLGWGVMFVTVAAIGGVIGNYYYEKLLRGESIWG